IAAPEGTGQSFTIALLQSDGQGQLVAAGPEGIFSAPSPTSLPVSAAGGRCAYNQIFWPQDRESIVVITGRPPGKLSDNMRVKVYELGDAVKAGAETSQGRGLRENGGSGPPQRVAG